MKTTSPQLDTDRNIVPIIIAQREISLQKIRAAVTRIEVNAAAKKPLPIQVCAPIPVPALHIAPVSSYTIEENQSNLVGESLSIQRIKNLILKVAPTNAKVLITGETGTGKELAARDIHQYSKRSDMPFVAINCAAIPKDLIDAELFGCESGAFTGATTGRPGLFDAANHGTIFLDEVAELPPSLQSKLDRVLEDGTFQRVGSTKQVTVDVRVIAATNRDLQQALIDGEITRGFYDRLNVFRIHMPALREHKEDLSLITEHLLRKHWDFIPDKSVMSFSEEALQKLLSHDWTGNVRELENVIRRAIVLTKGSIIQAEDILLTTNDAVSKVIDSIEDIALSNAIVFVRGESGTGKELVAKYIHQNSTRSEKPMIIVNCSKLNNDLAESELFGHIKNAFTGATKPHRGLFEEADGSTLLLDEVGALDLNTQKKLLRTIQEGVIIPIGSGTPKQVNVRIIATTCIDLEDAVKKRKFREDLFHRLNIIPIVLSPLRQRKEDIPELVNQFLKELKEYKTIPGISQEALAKLTEYDWPGNVRELKSTIERAVILADDGELIKPEHIVLDTLLVKEATLSRFDLSQFVANDNLHPAIKKRLDELVQLATNKGAVDDLKLRFLVIQCRILQLILDSGCKPQLEKAIIDELKIPKTTLRFMLKRIGYPSVDSLAATLLNEVHSNSGNGNQRNGD